MSISASTDLRNILSGLFLLNSSQLDALQAHYELLLRWNRVLNLTTVEGAREAAERHYAESLLLASRLPNRPLRIADLGSGAGFPGFPVAVMRPDCGVALIESHQRKAVFLREASRKVENIRVLVGRAESVTEAFDILVSRAVSYEDLRPNLARLASGVLLLTGPEAPPDDMGIEWEGEEKLPWGKQRFLRVGVSRETRGAKS
ncbi:MAG TPA: 16S rRNA (guanine(527)-N(7))-methyltransferase RsmG [Bryobacteraceae bacterium]|nr:16S rRNA (guanine(527)-N(7))-methyltransferase RsmG [Bryobacteraceae bacterium]